MLMMLLILFNCNTIFNFIVLIKLTIAKYACAWTKMKKNSLELPKLIYYTNGLFKRLLFTVQSLNSLSMF